MSEGGGRAEQKLLDVGLVDRDERGKWAYFSLKATALEKLATVADLTHEVADGMHGAIVKAVRTTQPEAKGLPVIQPTAAAGCC